MGEIADTVVRRGLVTSTRAIDRHQSSHLLRGFRWRMSDGTHVAPQQMRTTHLFHTLRMIWNNACPAPLRVGKVRLYTFDSSVYTADYISKALYVMAAELGGRCDLPEWMRAELRQMAANMRRSRYAIPAPEHLTA